MVQSTQNWDDIRYAVFFLHRILESGWLLESSLATGALDNLKSLSRYLFDLAVIPVQGIYINKLTQADEDSLELQFAKLLDYDLKNSAGLPVSLKSTPVVISEFKVCVVNIGVYIMLKTRKCSKDLEFAINTLLLTFRAIQSCLSAGLISEFNRLLDWAVHTARPRLEDEKIYDFDRAPMERLFAPFNTCTTLMFVYRVIDLYQQKKYDDVLVLLKSTKEKPIDLNSQQSTSLSRICYNIGLTLFNQKSFENAIIWFKFSHAYGKEVEDPDNTEDALTLMAACYLQVDKVKYSSLAIEVLDYADDKKSINLELRLQAMLAAGKEIRVVVQYLAKFFLAKWKQTADANVLKEIADEFLQRFEDKKKLIELLASIPWCQDDPVPKEWPPMEPVRWVCAKFAARCFVDESQHDQLFQLLHRATQWLHHDKDSTIDSSCVAEVAALAESIAIHLRNEKNDPLECYRWYALIAKVASRHEIDSAASIVWNAMACSLEALPHPEGLSQAQELSGLIPQSNPGINDASMPINQLCIRLQMALLGGDGDKALAIVKDFDSARLSNEDLNRVLTLLSRCVFIAEGTGLDFILNFLQSALEQCRNQQCLLGILMQFIFRIQLQHLRNASLGNDGQAKETCLNVILATLESANQMFDESSSNGIRTWFANSAWNLGRQCKILPRFRHHFFKLSYQMFPSTSAPNISSPPPVVVAICSQDEMKMMAMIGAIEAAFDYGSQEDSNRIPYVRLLKSNLTIVEDFNSLVVTTQNYRRRQMLVRLMEFHTLCELKSWQKVEQLSSELMTTYKDDADFLQSLAAVAMSVKDATVSDEMTCPKDNARPQQLPSDTFRFCRRRVAAPQRQLLAAIAANSLRGAIDRSQTHARPSKHIFLLCQWLTSVLFDDQELLQEPLQRFRYDAMNVLQDCLRSPDHPFAQARWMLTKIQNVSLLCTDQRQKRQILRWLEESQQQSPHAAKLKKLFQRP